MDEERRPDCRTCTYGYTCSQPRQPDGEPAPERVDCITATDWTYKHYEFGDPIQRQRDLQFSGQINIVLHGEHEVNCKWNYDKTFEHLVETCENVGFMTYRHPTNKTAIRCETSYGPAFDLFFSEDREKMTHITVKRSRREVEEKIWDFSEIGDIDRVLTEEDCDPDCMPNQEAMDNCNFDCENCSRGGKKHEAADNPKVDKL